METITSGVAQAISALLEDHGIDRQDIAAAIGRSPQYVSDRLNGKKGLTVGTDIIVGLGRVMGISDVMAMQLVADQMGEPGRQAVRARVARATSKRSRQE